MSEFFPDVPGPVPFIGIDGEGLGYRVYDSDQMVGDKSMADHLRLAVCYWHSFNWPGSDIFGDGTFDRPWLARDIDPMRAAEAKQDAAFEFISKLGARFFSFHDVDMAPQGASLKESRANLDAMVDRAAAKMSQTGVELLWGTANLFSHPRFAAGAATNPNPEVFAHAAAQVRHMLDATHRLGGHNYVLWGGREGYETLLNTRMRQEADQLARFLSMVVDYKRTIGFEGTLLLEPKPQEPTKHQYDYDCATVHGFLDRYDLLGEFKVNIEGNHATLAGHSFHHEVAYAIDHGIFGSIDANRGDHQNGWDTDQFPTSVDELVPPVYEILRGGGFETGGFMFDTKLRRQSIDRSDLFHGHVGGIDALAKALLVAHKLLSERTLEGERDRRYAGWTDDLGTQILSGSLGLGELADRAVAHNIDPTPVSGGQERLENEINHAIWSTS
ncbi:MAG: xylose isomerase [Actinomycetia bacterium]|nr:xylose isomerase [Actinomycetes bacterium]